MSPRTARWYEPSKRERLSVGQVVAEKAAAAPNVQTVNYTLVAADAGRTVEVNAATGKTVTVPAGVFTPGQKVQVVQVGVGQVTVTGGAGFTLTSPAATTKTVAQWGTVTIAFRDGASAILSGGIAAA